LFELSGKRIHQSSYRSDSRAREIINDLGLKEEFNNGFYMKVQQKIISIYAEGMIEVNKWLINFFS